ncbi:MAG TPA: transcription-repair coupling factor [Myxococcota bacterium]|nr:transcription-repair coupling factor [Myxococcota bacterium]
MDAYGPQRTARALVAPLVERLERDGLVNVRGVSPNARPWMAAALVRGGAGPFLWILPDEAGAERAFRAARFFLGDTGRDPVDPFAGRVAYFPLHQELPYYDLSPDRLLVADRLALLFRLVHGPCPDLIVASLPSVLRLGMPRAALDDSSLLVLRGQETGTHELAAFLSRAGFFNVPLVEDPGTFAVRGGIVDIFTPLLPQPVRIELLGDEVESIRAFDPQTQRTVSPMDAVYLGPVREIVWDAPGRERAALAVERRADELDISSGRLLAHLRALKDGVWSFGIEALLPAFHPRLESLLDYLHDGVRLIISEPGTVEQAALDVWQRAETACDESIHSGALVFPPRDMLLSADELAAKIRARVLLNVGLVEHGGEQHTIASDDVRDLREAIRKAGGDDPLQPLVDLLSGWRRERLRPFIVSSRPGRSRELAAMLRRRNIPVRVETDDFDPAWAEKPTPSPPVRIVPGDIEEGFSCPEAGVGFLPDSDVFGRPVRASAARPRADRISSLSPGDIIVHVDFGIGRFEGMHKLEVVGSEADYLLLIYRGGDRLYLPVTRMNLIERYLGGTTREGAVPVLSKLGGKTWERTKRRVQEALLEMADGLIRIEAARRTTPGLPAKPPGEDYQRLEASFPFVETEDQRKAIAEVFDDILSSRVMDRLICGDVGFGKTEVALRAAYLNALSGRQTAVLVPTTILALQHLSTFRERLEKQAVNLEMLSRLVKPGRQKEILAGLAAGTVDVVIGTHRLLGDDVKFANLGLLVIDEEHRFGVRHKERLKKLKQNVDVLTMTATPLPRTLQMSLTGLRDISVIQTAPPGRRSIRTMITRFSRRVISEAIQRELERGGQVFFLHNWVRSLPSMMRYLEKIVPKARYGLAHGRMNERRLERAMGDFVAHKLDVLVCTSIIESGLDIPAANTMIINRADRFGLSQLHQIRGRVGRSSERGYAYLLIPGLAAVTTDARRRLEVLTDLSEPGAGYRIASEDLEIRGAGNLLGKAQSGHIAAVGFDLYSRLLERAVAEARGKGAAGSGEPEISLPVAGLIPEDYVPELDQRLALYARLSRVASEEDVFDLEREIVDRYGPEPPQVENLCELTAIKTLLRDAGVASLEARGGELQVRPGVSTRIDVERLARLVQEQTERIILNPDGLIRVRLDPQERQEILQAARSLIAELFSR